MEHLTFDDMRLFARVAALGSFSAVARERLVAVTRVSRCVERMEQACGATLVARGSQGVRLTAEGEVFLAACAQAEGLLDEARLGLHAQAQAPVQGHICVSASAIVAQHWLVPSLPALLDNHPSLRLDVRVSDDVVDLLQAGVDVAVRAGPVTQGALVARRLGHIQTGLYASPAYLALFGTPDTPDALASHRMLANCTHPSLNAWRFVSGQARVADGRLRASSTPLLLAMVQQGLGIAQLPCAVAQAGVAAGTLAPVLASAFVPEQIPVHAVYSPALRLAPRVQVCVAHWVRWFAAQAQDSGATA